MFKFFSRFVATRRCASGPDPRSPRKCIPARFRWKRPRDGHDLPRKGRPTAAGMRLWRRSTQALACVRAGQLTTRLDRAVPDHHFGTCVCFSNRRKCRRRPARPNKQAPKSPRLAAAAPRTCSCPVSRTRTLTDAMNALHPCLSNHALRWLKVSEAAPASSRGSEKSGARK